MATLPEIAPSPGWVTAGADLVSGLDLLGLRVPVQAIGNTLLTGITTISPTVRYVGLRSWIAHRYAEARLPDSWASFREFAGRVEAAIAIGNLLVERHTGGLVGRDVAAKLVDTGEDPLALEPLTIQLAVSSYGGPSDQLGVSFPRDTAVPGLTEERGLPLARAIEGILGTTAFGRTIRDDPAIAVFSRNVLSEAGAAFRIGSPVGDERIALLEAILPSNPRPPEITRLATYGVLLSLCESRRRRVQEQDLFETAIAPTRLPEEVYQPCLDGWVKYLVRDMVAVAHEAALAAIIDEIAPKDGQITRHRAHDAMSALLAREGELEEPLRTLGILPGGKTPLDQPLHALETAVRDSTRPRTASAIPRWDGPAEPAIISLALSGGAGVLTLLPLVWLLGRERVSETRELDAEGELLSYQGWGRMGFRQVILPGLEDLLRRKVTIRAAAHELALRSVDQHLRIAWSRMAADPRKDVAVLTADADTWYFRKRFRGGRTASRLTEAISWLSQLGLIEDAGCTEEGRKHLVRIRSILSAVGGSA